MKNGILINDTSMEGHIGSKQVIDNIKRLCLNNKVKIVSTFSREDIQKWCPRLDERLETCDIIIINGEGTFHHNPPFFDILVSRRHNYKGKKIAFINSVWQNMENFNMDKFFDMCDIISFRETLSGQQFIDNYKKTDKMFIVPDVIFATDVPELNIGFGDSVIPETNDILINHYNKFPMHNSKQPDLTAYLAWLKSLTFHITGRYHGVCLSILVGTPFCCYKSNSHKIEGLLKDMKCEYLLMDINKKIDVSKLDFVILRGKMKEYRIGAKERIEDLFYRIGEL